MGVEEAVVARTTETPEVLAAMVAVGKVVAGVLPLPVLLVQLILAVAAVAEILTARQMLVRADQVG